MGLSTSLNSIRTMPKEILIVDDRPKRPSLHLDTEELDELRSLVTMSETLEVEDLEQYDLIAIHRSYVINKGLGDQLDNLIKKNGLYVILFSGGIGQPTITSNGHLAIIGSDLFYSKNLIDFCKDLSGTDSIQLYKLVYGVKKWQLPLYSRLRQLLWIDPSGSNFDYSQERKSIMNSLQLNSIDEIPKAINRLVLGL